ncbi:acetylxylan esterase [Bacteroidota bacterium]
MRSPKQILQVLIILNLFIAGHLPAQVSITPNNPEGVYKAGETVKWTLMKRDTITLDSVRYTLKKGGLTPAGSGSITFDNNMAEISYTFDSPGTILLDVRWGEKDNWRNKRVGGAVASPGKLKLSSSKPADFNAFWESKLRELSEVPTNPELEESDSEIEGVKYWKITMDNIRNSRIQGQLARPIEGDKLPALLIVQWAGVYPLEKNWVLDRSKSGWLVLNINPHDLPIDEERSYYQERARGDLRNYPAIGNDDRETSYFLRMYLSCYRATQYLTERPDWNGKTLVVTGDSQGGLQTLMTAGFHPAVTAAMALVPAGFDMLGPEVGRKGGWPQWYNQTEGKDINNVREASRYFDVANFIPKIKCPVLVGIGLLDETCPPEGILAGLNQIKKHKEILILPKSGHQDRNGSQKHYRIRRDDVWLPALKAGEKAPVNKKM